MSWLSDFAVIGLGGWQFAPYMLMPDLTPLVLNNSVTRCNGGSGIRFVCLLDCFVARDKSFVKYIGVVL